MPTKFGFDKRRNQLSSLILTKQLSRDEAIESSTFSPAKTIEEDFEYIANKLDISISELRDLFNGENKTFRDYKNKMFILELGAKVIRFFGENRIIR